tara:strand:+ start:38 stop:247 length:210 start_codon:yes stop_codon:yes gene_type:complete
MSKNNSTTKKQAKYTQFYVSDSVRNVEEDDVKFVYKRYNGEMSVYTQNGNVRFCFTKKMMERMMEEMEN